MYSLDDFFNQGSSKKSEKKDKTENQDSGSYDSNSDEKTNSNNYMISDKLNEDKSVDNIADTYESVDADDNTAENIDFDEKLSKIFNGIELNYDDEFELNVEKSEVLANIEEYDEAIKYLDNALKIKNDIKVFYLKAEYLHELNKDSESLKIIDENVLGINPDYYDGLKLKVLLLCRLNQFDLAEKVFNMAININPIDYEIYQQYADEFDFIGNTDRALEINKKAYSKFPDVLDLLYDRRYYLVNGGYDESLINQLNNKIYDLESKSDEPDYSSGILNIHNDDIELEPENDIGSRGYENNDADNSDENDIYDLDSENNHYDDNENIVDLDYEEELKESNTFEEDELKEKMDKSKTVTLDNFF